MWVQQVMLLCVHLPSVSADLLVKQILFFNLVFWILCRDVVIHVHIEIAWLLLVCTPVPPHGLGEAEGLEGEFEGASLAAAFTALRHCWVPRCW